MSDTECGWFEREGALRVERGEPVGDHLAACPACAEAYTRYRALTSEIEHTPIPAPSSEVSLRMWRILEGLQEG